MSWNNLERVPRPRSRVLIVYAGGTIGMARSHDGLSNLGPAAVVDQILDYGADQEIGWELTELLEADGSSVPPIDSAAVQPRHWLLMAALIERRYSEFDGFVILHGTDTLAYTASALSFLLVNLSKPVVLTGSQQPLFMQRTDAHMNLLNSLYIAGYRATGVALVPEVSICFGDVLLRGNRSRKARTSGWQGFVSPNYPPLAQLGESIQIFHEVVRPVPFEPFRAERALAEDVLDLTLFPGIRPAQIEALLTQSELKGVVLRAYGAGNAPGDPQLLGALGRAVERGKTVLIVSQCPQGRVELGRYASSHGLLECGAVSGFDLTPEAALTKLMWVLAEAPSSRGAATGERARLQRNQRGEQSLDQHEVRLAVSQGEGGLTLGGVPEIARLERALLRVHGLQPGVHLGDLSLPTGEVLVDVTRWLRDGLPLELVGASSCQGADLVLLTES